jgi:hypothetical protein
MSRKEDQPVNLSNNIKTETFTRPAEVVDGWIEGEFTRINSVEVGTPCLRYLLRQPDGHRDVDKFDTGEYVFSAFGFRHDIGGEIKQLQRERPILGNLPLIAYYPESDEEPFGKDFFGISSPGLFNYEVLDRFQQKLTLVGVAHLHIHAPDMKGAVIASFNENGSLRYIEAKQGERRDHDSILLYEDRIEFKIGSQLTGMKQNTSQVFGVPRWAFSEDISTKVFVNFNNEDGIEVVRNTPDGESLRIGHPTEPDRFSNRNIGTEVQVNTSTDRRVNHNIDYKSESSQIGNSRLRLEQIGTVATLIINSDEGERQSILSADLSLFRHLAEGLETLTLGVPDNLDMNTVADYSEYLFMRFHSLLASRTQEGVFLKNNA